MISLEPEGWFVVFCLLHRKEHAFKVGRLASHLQKPCTWHFMQRVQKVFSLIFLFVLPKMMHKRLSCVLSGLRFCMCEYWIYGTYTHMNHMSREIFSFWLVLVSVYNKNCSICCHSSLPSGFLCSLKNPIQIFMAEIFWRCQSVDHAERERNFFPPHTCKNWFQLNYSAEKRKSWLAWMTEIEVKVELSSQKPDISKGIIRIGIRILFETLY